ncbi:MAG: heparinase II/III-family protein [Tannerella sp.]|nr:heparinase II/III-family protein [Tannerella sp.]
MDNPVTVSYLKKKLRKSHPRLVLNSSIEKDLKKKIQSDSIVKNYYAAIRLNAANLMDKPFLERIVTGRRLLSVSREMLYRVNMLGMVYRMEKDPEILRRLNGEILAVCNFPDWNPSHYLDVAEMAMAVALAVDWGHGDLPQTTVDLAISALIEKGIQPSWQDNGRNAGWATGGNNWNQVCNGGMIAASIAIAEKDPELAAKTVKRALDGLPNALASYLPDGVYPEGSTYWGYGTGFSVITCAMLESAFGTDFGHTRHAAYMNSALFRVLCNAPTGRYYNFADCGDRRGNDADEILAWFGAKTGNKAFFEAGRLMIPPAQMGKLSRLGGAALVWISQYKEKPGAGIPSVWAGRGHNPIAIFTGENGYYFGGKGGRATTSHGNMDAGSFIFELGGVRWVVDPGNQDYHELEQTGFDLWSSCQDCQRWTLLTKNNYAHSTLTVNNQLHRVNGEATLLEIREGDRPEAVFDITGPYGNLLKSAKRTFTKDGAASITVTDEIETSPETELITWQLMTTADVELIKGGAILRQDGRTLKLNSLSHPDWQFSLVSFDPAPLALDRQIKGLKRIDLRIPAWTVKDGRGIIKIRLTE